MLPTVLNNNECMIGIPLKIAFDIVFTQHIRLYSLENNSQNGQQKRGQHSKREFQISLSSVRIGHGIT